MLVQTLTYFLLANKPTKLKYVRVYSLEDLYLKEVNTSTHKHTGQRKEQSKLTVSYPSFRLVCSPVRLSQWKERVWLARLST